MTSIFLSYARNDDEPFVRRLYEDLKAHGFKVWFDRVDMPSRNLTFHQEIRDAVAAHDRLLLVVGPKAVASEYVRQEWQFAWFEAEKVVTPILRLNDKTADGKKIDGYTIIPDELKLLHCEDFRDDAQYQAHLRNLIQSLEAPPAPMGKLIAVPSLPAHYLSRSDRLIPLRDAVRSGLDSPAPFGGMAARQQFHGIAGAAKHVGMHGMGGIGKSVLANLLAHDRKIREAFPDGIVWVGLGSVPIVADLMRRIHVDLGGDGAFFTEHEGKAKLKELLTDKAVLLVLDDAWRRQDIEAFDMLGPRCRALITTRDAGLLTSVGGTQHLVELLTDDEALRLLALAVGKELDELPAEARRVLKQCGRLPLAVSLAGGMVAAGMSWTHLLTAFDRHTLEFFEDEHRPEQHQSLWKMIEMSVRALDAAEQMRLVELGVFPEDEAVPEKAVATLWQHTGHLDDLDTPGLLVKLKQRSLVQLSTGEQGGVDVGRVSLHDLVHDYCLRRAQVEFGKPAFLHDMLLAAYRQQAPGGWWTGPNDGYFLSHLRDHLVAAGRGNELADLLHELPWLEAKNAVGLVFDLPRDFKAATDALPKTDDRHRILRLLDEALRRDIHFIARHAHDYPQGLFQCLWNTCWWYDCPDASQHYELPEPAATIIPPWDQTGEKLYLLMKRWRTLKQTQPRANWIRELRPPCVPLGSPQVALLRGHDGFVTCLALSLDGRLIASGSDDVTVRIWNTETGEELLCLPGESSPVLQQYVRPVHAVALSPVEPLVASGAHDGKVRVWELTSGKMRWMSWPDDPELPGWVTSVAFSADGQHLFCRNTQSGLQIRKVTTGEIVPPWPNDSEPIITLAFSADGWETKEREASALAANGAWFAAFLKEGTLCVWDAVTGQLRRSVRISGYRTERVAITNDGLYVALAHDWEIDVWDVERGMKCRTLRGHGYRITGLHFVPEPASTNSLLLVSSSNDSTIRIWDTRKPDTLVTKDKGLAFIQEVAFSPDGRYVASIDFDGHMTIWDPVQAVPLRSLAFGRSGPFSLMFSRTGRHLYIQTMGAIYVWRTMSRCPKRQLRFDANDSSGTALSKQWREIWRKEMGPDYDEEKIWGGWASGTPGIPFGPYWIRKGASEMEIRTHRGSKIVCWHPCTLYETAWHPSGRIVGGREGNRLCLLQVEGPSPDEVL